MTLVMVDKGTFPVYAAGCSRITGSWGSASRKRKGSDVPEEAMKKQMTLDRAALGKGSLACVS